MFAFCPKEAKWFYEPRRYALREDRVTITTDPHTDFWQRTYYGFRNDNAHVLYVATAEPFFSFTVKAEWNSSGLFDQCGVAIYQNSENWVKAAVEFHNADTAWLGSVVTNHGYSDWATTEIGGDVKRMWYRLSRRGSDYCIENSPDGTYFSQMRIFHLFEGAGEINIGLIACSPSDSSFDAVFSDIRTTECLWKAHQ